MSDTVTYNLYQAKLSCTHIFRDQKEMENVNQNGVNPDDYDLVYTGTLMVQPGEQPMSILERLFIIFNRDDRPGRTAFRSMSVSDIIELTIRNETKCYYCSSIGFSPVTFLKK